ncbi:solute carrier family 35, member E1 [Sporothrix brasiliensis 5110]|uniref:Solute carrier family 35, member E1 n=1 Tax=Sporothrix brasiliensis 5110 TaxID=1398154 RepID=A0A0C2J7K9_9PEZI|nr:solute carrier family 35, member E1 [Sporothrix brasiliensis 5110]KIH94985.1 solute carrier family 35, member E1 [Sporothrix brasiliensis 5110]
MPHATTTATTVLRKPSPNNAPAPRRTLDVAMGSQDEGLEKFPELDVHDTTGLDHSYGASSNKANGTSTAQPSLPPMDQWRARKDSSVRWNMPPVTNGYGGGHGHGHSRQKSLGEALRTIRTRSASTSQNVHEIADALKAPVSPMLISILNAFEKPATLTIVQFAFVSFLCILLSWLARVFPSLKRAMPVLKHGIRYPDAEIIRTTLPLAGFQIAGHLLSSTATTKISVSLVHTIKGLSPLFTVFAYRIFLDIRYPTATYLSLVPLTLGVALACSGGHSFSGGQLLGILYALVATGIFVTQNIVSKKLFNEASRAEAEGLSVQARKLDKLNLLCYSSGMAFVITGPIWFWTEGIGLLGDFLYDGSLDLTEGPDSFGHGRLFLEFVFNGFFHFAQNMLAFVLLSRVSPVTYSVASLIKRVFVISVAIVWFRSPTTWVQAVGIGLTFLGLYLYDRTNQNKADRRARTMTGAKDGEPLLPLNSGPSANGIGLGLQNTGGLFENGSSSLAAGPHPYTAGYSVSAGEDYKKSDDFGRETLRGSSAGTASWMPPRTRQEDTWRVGDQVPTST